METSYKGTHGKNPLDDIFGRPLEEEHFVDLDSSSLTTDDDNFFDKMIFNDDVMLRWLRDTEANDVNVDDMLNMVLQGPPIGEGFSNATAQKSTSQDLQPLLCLPNCDEPYSLASFLQARLKAFANLDKKSIIELLEKGVKMGLKPKISCCDNHETQFSSDVAKRNGKKRSPYKMAKKESWTSTRKSGESGSAVLNVLHNKRTPSTDSTQRYLYINDVDLNEDSMGVAEVS